MKVDGSNVSYCKLLYKHIHTLRSEEEREKKREKERNKTTKKAAATQLLSLSLSLFPTSLCILLHPLLLLFLRCCCFVSFICIQSSPSSTFFLLFSTFSIVSALFFSFFSILMIHFILSSLLRGFARFPLALLPLSASTAPR